jgi:hypothetical protein
MQLANVVPLVFARLLRRHTVAFARRRNRKLFADFGHAVSYNGRIVGANFRAPLDLPG